jgi:hypothetical protein
MTSVGKYSCRYTDPYAMRIPDEIQYFARTRLTRIAEKTNRATKLELMESASPEQPRHPLLQWLQNKTRISGQRTAAPAAEGSPLLGGRKK